MKILLVLALFCAPVCFAQDTSIEVHTDRVEALHASLITLLQTEDYDARVQIIAPYVDELFDVQRIAQVSIGRKWRELSESEQSEFVGLLKELIVATYAARFNAFDGQRFETMKAQKAANGVLVSTRLITEKQTVRLDYFFRGGRIFNVAADGVSDLSLRRADYGSIIKDKGYAALLEHINQKIREARHP